MLRSITVAGAVVLSIAVLFLLPPRGQDAVAQSGPLYIAAVDYDIVPAEIDNYLTALKENAVASVKEPGCREFNIAVSQKDPNHVFIFEVYDSAAAVEAHRATDHFKKYQATMANMVVKREARPLWSVAMNMKGM